MSLIDEHGRLLGRVNLIDAAAAGLLLVLVPLAYAAYLLFRIPMPRIHPIEPVTVQVMEGSEPPQIVVTGEHLRPYLRARVGGMEGTYLFEAPERVIVRLPRQAPGTYDLAFFDEALEIARQKNAITFAALVVPEPPPPPSAVMVVRLVGAFTGLSPERAHALQASPAVAREMTAGWGAILGLDRPEPDIAVLKNDILPGVLVGRQRVPAVLRVRSAVVDGTLQLLDSEGRVLGSANSGTVSPGAVLSIPAAPGHPGASGTAARDVVTFHVDQVYPDGTRLIELTARVITRPPIVELLRKSLTEPEPPSAFAALRPQLLSFEVEREVPGTTFDELRQGTTSILIASFRLPVARTASGWEYGRQQLKPGVDFYLETSTYRVLCQVLTIETRSEAE